jgi:transposase
VVPRVIAGAGDAAARRFLEFFAATIRNKNTRKLYDRTGDEITLDEVERITI